MLLIKKKKEFTFILRICLKNLNPKINKQILLIIKDLLRADCSCTRNCRPLKKRFYHVIHSKNKKNDRSRRYLRRVTRSLKLLVYPPFSLLSSII